jgi:hypothetical protein
MHGSLASRFCGRILGLLAFVLVLVHAPPAGAGIILSVQDVSASAGSSGNTFEVDVQNTGPAAVDVAAFSFEISVATSSGVTLTGADTSTTVNPYIFAGNSFLGPNIATSTGTTLDASDLATAGSTTLAPGDTFGLGRVSFEVLHSAALGPVAVTFTAFPATSLSAPDLSNIQIDTLNGGTITITAATVPEPSSLISATLGLVGAAWFIRRSRALIAR